MKHRGLHILEQSLFEPGEAGFRISDNGESIPAWEERGYADLEDIFPTVEAAKAAIDGWYMS